MFEISINHVTDKTIHCVVEKPNGVVLKMLRVKWGHEKYKFLYLKTEEGFE